MTEHPITPPPELVEKWGNAAPAFQSYGQSIANQAARWGADQELEACCRLFESNSVCGTKFQRRSSVRDLRNKRRPEPKKISMTLSITATEAELQEFIRQIKDDRKVSIEF
jgi:hypothetical protein